MALDLAALQLRLIVLVRESARDRYARAADWHARTRGADWPRGCKMSATYQLKKAARDVDALLW